MTDNKSAFSSAEYDKTIRETVSFYEEFFVQIVNALRAAKSDIGCGMGEMARPALGRIDMECFVFCDSSEKCLRLRNRFAASNTEFIRADICSLPFNEQFDVVTAIMINHYFDMNNRAKLFGIVSAL